MSLFFVCLNSFSDCNKTQLGHHLLWTNPFLLPISQNWLHRLAIGEKLRYACREFVRGHGDDEERLMRRIMIARRNNIRDHQTLKRARKLAGEQLPDDGMPASKVAKVDEPSPSLDETFKKSEAAVTRRRRPAAFFSDAHVEKEMDVPAVTATRSYRAWLKLEDGQEFVYNQKYIKGKEGNDWLLKKNIWRRMRYRRENKKMVEEMRQTTETTTSPSTRGVDSQIVDRVLLTDAVTASSTTRATAAAAAEASTAESQGKKGDGDFEVSAAVEAAVAAAESYKIPYNDIVHNPLEAAANTGALDAAARLAAAAASNGGVDIDAAIAAAEAAAQQQTAV